MFGLNFQLPGNSGRKQWRITPKKLYTLEGKPPSAFVCPVMEEGLSTLPDFVQKNWRE
jgi:hypothetical protein